MAENNLIEAKNWLLSRCQLPIFFPLEYLLVIVATAGEVRFFGDAIQLPTSAANLQLVFL